MFENTPFNKPFDYNILADCQFGLPLCTMQMSQNIGEIRYVCFDRIQHKKMYIFINEKKLHQNIINYRQNKVDELWFVLIESSLCRPKFKPSLMTKFGAHFKLVGFKFLKL